VKHINTNADWTLQKLITCIVIKKYFYFKKTIGDLINLRLIVLGAVKINLRETTQMTTFCTGESVKHKKRAEWGIGKIIAVDKCGTIRVVFDGNKDVSLAKGSNYLIKVKENVVE